MSVLVVENSILKKRKYDLIYNDEMNYKHYKSNHYHNNDNDNDNDNDKYDLNNFLNKIIKRIDQLEDTINSKIIEFDKKLTSIDNKLTLIDRKINNLNIGYNNCDLFKNDCPYIS